MRALASHKLLLDASVSSNSQYPSGKKDEDGEAGGNSAQAEKKMRTSLLSNLKAKFVAEDASTQASTSTLPKVEE